MRLLADLHTHTLASGHAYSTLTENAQAARLKGLELIAITDHGPTVPQGAHPWYFWNLKAAPVGARRRAGAQGLRGEHLGR